MQIETWLKPSSIFALGRLVSPFVRRFHRSTRSFRVPSSSTALLRVSCSRPGSLTICFSSPIASLQTRCLPRRAFATVVLKNADVDTSGFFEYTSGRYIVNEKLRLAERKRHFNLTQLLLFAAQSVNRSPQDITHIEKFAEGGFNRVFLITMHDGFRMIARIPYPTPNMYEAVASEVATMVYLRSMGIPEPEVYGYSACKGNKAGTEFTYLYGIYGGQECG